MKTRKKLLSVLLAMSMVAGSFAGAFGGMTAEAESIQIESNLALGKPATAFQSVVGSDPGLVTDGNTGSPQWQSVNMKNGQIDADAAQTPMWVQVDLGKTGAEINQIKLWYNAKVWPMVYRLETSDTPEVETSWETIVAVDRRDATKPENQAGNGWVTNNGTDYDIANNGENTDTITTTSSPSLETTVLKRYVRFYVEKVNCKAPGNNVNLREIQIMGFIEGVEAEVYGSEFENVISNDGTESEWNIGSREVTLLLKDELGAMKNTVVTVEDHSANYPAEWFPAVENQNAKPEVIPTIQEWYGYEGDFVLAEDSKIILNDAANVGLDKVAQNMKKDILEICGIDLEVTEGTEPGDANDIYIESLTDAEKYDIGEEGYVMVTNDEGIQIFANSYTGCIYGTITVEQILWLAEDHASVPKGIMRDYPAYEIRGVKLDIARTPYRYQQLKDYAKIMLWYKMNEYDLHINDNDNANVNWSTDETHSGFHRLESETFPSLISETKHIGFPSENLSYDYYNFNEDYQGNPMYSKEEYRALAQMTEDYGMYLLTEIDLPGHSLLYNKYAEENPDNLEMFKDGGVRYPNPSGGQLELLDLTGPNSARALEMSKMLWDEYTRGDEPTIYGDVVHIGADEYWVHNDAVHNAFASFADEMRKVIQKNLGEDTKIRMWGAGTMSFATAEETLGMTSEELASHYQLDVWYPGYENAAQRAAEGYGIVNCRDCYMYGNPGRTFRDVPNAEYLFYDWNPTMFGGGNPMMGEPNLLGAKAVIWGDQSQEGMTEKDVHERVLQAISIVSEKTWNGTDEDDTFAEWEIRKAHLAEGPGTQIAMEVKSASSLVLSYDFANISEDGKTVYDASGNGYDAAVTGGNAEDGWMTFDGETLLETPVKTVSYPYTVSFDLKLSAADGKANNRESSLFSGYDGRIQVAGYNGELSADVNYFSRNFGYKVPTDGTEVEVTLVGTLHGTKLYVDGELVTFLSQKADQDGLGTLSSIYSSVLLPLEKIGQDFNGQMANLKVYNKALSAEEVAAVYAGTDDGKVNVAQNTYAGSNSYRTGDAFDDAEQRTRTSKKAIDGDAFEVQANADAQPNAASSDIYSYWRGDHADSALTVDLGQAREISEIGIQWRVNGKGKNMDILTSMDGENWTVAKEVRNNTAFFQTVAFDAPVEARYVKVQGIASNASIYMIQELMVYEYVDKAALADALSNDVVADVLAGNADAHKLTAAEAAAIYDAAIYAEALQESPLATIAEVDGAVAAVEAALAAVETKPDVPEIPETEVCKVFTDVTHGAWYEGAVQYVYDRELILGNGDLFSPDNATTRAMVATILHRLAGSPAVTDYTKYNKFTDVEAGAWYAEAVAWALNEGLATGDDYNMLFNPNADVTREQLATFLYRYAEYAGKDVTVEGTYKDLFGDTYVNEWAKAGFAWAIENEIIKGAEMTDGAGSTYLDLNPQGGATRAQLATVLQRYLD